MFPLQELFGVFEGVFASLGREFLILSVLKKQLEKCINSSWRYFLVGVIFCETFWVSVCELPILYSEDCGKVKENMEGI